MNSIKLIGLALVAILSTGCVTTSGGSMFSSTSSGEWERSDALRKTALQQGVVTGYRKVTIKSSQQVRQIGATVGAAIGYIGGGKIGEGLGNQLARVVVAAVAAPLGAAVAGMAGDEGGVEVFVRLENGVVTSVVTKDDEHAQFPVGSRVMLSQGGSGTRLVRM